MQREALPEEGGVNEPVRAAGQLQLSLPSCALCSPMPVLIVGKLVTARACLCYNRATCPLALLQAVAEHPDNVLCHVAQCVSKGRLALFTDNKTKVRLAKEAQEAARTAIVVDPQSDIAHHLMGR